MKKIFVLIITTMILCACSACGAEKEVSPLPTSVSSATQPPMSEPTPAPTAIPTIVPTTEPAPEADASTLQEILDTRGDVYWILDLYEKTNQWTNGNVIITLTLDNHPLAGSTIINILGDKYCYSTVATYGSFALLFDGINTYEMDADALTYNRIPSNDDTLPGLKTEFLLGPDAKDIFLSAGVEVINDTPYIYEQYLVEGVNVTFYFDPDGNVWFIKQPVDGQDTLFTFTVEFTETPDDSVFTIPEEHLGDSVEEVH